MAAIGAVTVSERDAARRATVVVTIHRPIYHRALFWCGLRLFRVAVRIMGFAGTEIETELRP